MCMGGVADVTVGLSTTNTDYKEQTIVIEKNHIARTRPDRIVISYE